MADEVQDAPAPKKTYLVREGFWVHFDDGREPVEGGNTVDLTDEEALAHAVQIDDPNAATEDDAPKAKKGAGE